MARKKGSHSGPPNSNYGDSYNYKKDNSFEDIYSGKKYKGKKGKSNKVIIRNFIIIVLCILFIATGGIMIYGYKSLSSINYDPIGDEEDINGFANSSVDDITLDYTGKELLNDPMVLNILLFGSDSYSAGDGGRTDSILMVSIDNRHKKLKTTSFLRDMWVQIPGYGEDRINAAYAYGGPKLAIQTIEANFGIKVDRYVVADFPGFEAIINRLGGIDMELTEDECEYLNSHCDDPNKLYGAGVHHLSGLQALNHARNRDSVMSDFDRTSRQRDVVSAVVQKMKSSNVTQILQIISDVGPMVTTNLKKNEIATLAANSITYMNYPMEEYSVPELDNFTNLNINGASVLGIVDMEEARYNLAKFIFEDSISSNSSSSSSTNY
mgnify:CR=1 FL=1